MIYITTAVKHNLFNTGRFCLFSQKFTDLACLVAFSLDVLTCNRFIQRGHGYQGMALGIINDLGIKMLGTLINPHTRPFRRTRYLLPDALDTFLSRCDCIICLCHLYVPGILVVT